jgi:hypothetical protein
LVSQIKAIAEQKAVYAALLQNLGQASFEQIQQVLDDREEVAAEDGLTPELLQSLQSKINSQQGK